MNKPTYMAGQRFGYLTVRRRAGRNREQRALWLCQCDCGEWIKATPNNLQRGFHKACNVNGHRWNTPEEPTE